MEAALCDPMERLMTNKEQFEAVFERLKGILQPYEPHLLVHADGSTDYTLNTPYIAQFKKEVFFGGVQIKKNDVSYHLMPVYVFPTLLDCISPELKKRMQGKSCFNFTSINEAAFDELARLTERGFERFKQERFL
jgi:hypothetical protein